MKSVRVNKNPSISASSAQSAVYPTCAATSAARDALEDGMRRAERPKCEGYLSLIQSSPVFGQVCYTALHTAIV